MFPQLPCFVLTQRISPIVLLPFFNCVIIGTLYSTKLYIFYNVASVTQLNVEAFRGHPFMMSKRRWKGPRLKCTHADKGSGSCTQRIRAHPRHLHVLFVSCKDVGVFGL